MQKPSLPAAGDAVELLQRALSEGRSVILSLAAPPHVDRVPPLVTTCTLLFGLTEAEARVLVELMENGFVSKEGLHAAMSRDSKAISNVKTLGVVVHRIRTKLAGRDVKIVTVWGQGYTLAEQDRATLRKILAGYGADIVSAAAQRKPKPIPA